MFRTPAQKMVLWTVLAAAVILEAGLAVVPMHVGLHLVAAAGVVAAAGFVLAETVATW